MIIVVNNSIIIILFLIGNSSIYFYRTAIGIVDIIRIGTHINVIVVEIYDKDIHINNTIIYFTKNGEII
eukprot:CAMPEP_0171019266 /NCGR_PEP_ID=MMETSP0736-20130129/28962_1 /TAXON_ID=186038 /ORGANISM="Fragilariopsis kerguelensis, Strain L26-C5" /LENGTH=68 /DNA_ID=CAMNT_0011456333 /DNA_START=142 /DNA_END=348 /DNA_ORIENTATION=-